MTQARGVCRSLVVATLLSLRASARTCICGEESTHLYCGALSIWNHTCADEACGADDTSTRARYVRSVCCKTCDDVAPVFDDDGGATFKSGTSGLWIIANLAVVLLFACLWFCFWRCCDFDGPIRLDGVAPSAREACAAAFCRLQGLAALGFLCVGVVFFVCYLETDGRVRLQAAAAAAHFSAFLLYAIYPGAAQDQAYGFFKWMCCGTRAEWRSLARVFSSTVAWFFCAWASTCTFFGLLYHSQWTIYFFCCLPCFGCIKVARWLAFASKMSRRQPRSSRETAAVADSSSGAAPGPAAPVPATRIPLALAALLPAVTVAYADADEVVGLGDCELGVVTAQPCGDAAGDRSPGSLPTATEL